MNTQQDNVIDLKKRIAEESKSTLDGLVQEGARRMLQAALQQEVAEYVARHTALCDEADHRLVVRNGSLPERQVLTGAGPLAIKQPRVHDRRQGERFTSAILPPYMRRSPSLEALIPVLYLKGISTGDFTDALEAILGPGAAGLSSASIVRLKEDWTEEHQQWARRDLTGKRYVYLWADGIHFQVRLSEDRPCMLVVVGTTPDGRKELVGLAEGVRESTLSWKELLLDLRRRGLDEAPELAVGDGALGFWQALREVFPATREQRCWVHKTANVLDKLPKSLHKAAKEKLHQMYLSPTKQEALGAFDDFVSLYEAKYPKASECLVKDKQVLFTFYDFPAQHWRHLRTTNPIESTFATVRHRTRQTKGCGSTAATTAMVYKLAREAERRWRRLNGSHLIVKVMEGVTFKDGEEVKQQAA